MKIVHSNTAPFNSETIVTIGTFDGVHIGHQKIIKKIINASKKNNLKSVVFTFFPHPRMVLQKDTDIKLINTLNERSDILDNLGLDYLFIHEFTKEFSRLTAKEFVSDILVHQLHIKKIIIGYDHHFGRNRTANIDDLKLFGALYGFEVIEISAQDINDVAVSSTKIRNALYNGDIKTANTYLGYNFMITGKVKRGKGLGKQLDFPTANLHVEEDYKLIPKQGVYIVKSTINNARVFGMMNIGINPTINEGNDQSLGCTPGSGRPLQGSDAIKIEFLDRIRDEQKFDSIEALKNQLQKDKKTTLEYICKYYDK